MVNHAWVAAAFAVTESLSTAAYLPQVLLYARDRSMWRGISVKSWSLWFVGCVAKQVYIAGDSGVSLLRLYLWFDIFFTLAVTAMGIAAQMHRRDRSVCRQPPRSPAIPAPSASIASRPSANPSARRSGVSGRGA